jgi:hypothetical protein
MRTRIQTTSQVGAVYVEAAIVMPVLILVTFASLFFLLVAARHFSLQMLANEIAKDISLSLQPAAEAPVPTGVKQLSCIPECMRTSNLRTSTSSYLNTRNIDTYAAKQMESTGCWNTCARTLYLLATPQTKSTAPALGVAVTSYPTMQVFDEQLPANQGVVSAGDFFQVSVSYPLRAVWGGGIAFFGLIPESSRIYGTAVGVVDKRENP